MAKRKTHFTPVQLLLRAVLIAGLLYSFVWSAKFIEYERKYLQFSQSQTQLQKYHLSSQLAVFSFPGWWVGNIDKALGTIAQIQSQQQNVLAAESKRIDDSATQVIADYRMLNTQLTLLGLEPENFDITAFQNEKDQTKKVQEYEDLQNSIQWSKHKIKVYVDARKKQGKLVNPLWGKTDSELADMIKHMSLQDKVGQLFIFQAQGQTAADAYLKQLNSMNQGGVVLMGDNVSSPEQLKNFTNDLQANAKIPLFISVDEEGGEIQRLKWDDPTGEPDWKSLSDAQLCDLGKKRSQILKDAGVNLNFAPVVDLTNSSTAFINLRTISSDPEVVKHKAQIFINCSNSKNIFTGLKHFPGHGATTENSHVTLPLITKSKDQWLNSDGLPFKELQGEKMVMVGHFLYKDLDPDHASSQSKNIVDGVLRNELGYSGVVITDAMGMIHNSTHISVYEAVKNVINAGIDIVLYVTTIEPPEDTKAELVKAVQKGDVSESRVDESVLRVLKLKREITFN